MNFKERTYCALTSQLPGAFFSIFDSLVTILTLGYYNPGTAFKFLAFRMRIEFYKKIKSGGSLIDWMIKDDSLLPHRKVDGGEVG